MRQAALFTRPLAANAAGNGAGVTPLLPSIDGARPVRPVERVRVDEDGITRGTDKAELFVVAPEAGRCAEGRIGLIVGYDRGDGLDLSRLGRFAVVEVSKVDNVYGDLPLRIAPLEGRKLSLDLDADGRADAYLLVAGDGFLPLPARDLPGDAVSSPPVARPLPLPLPAEPPGGWRTNMPMPPGGPAITPTPGTLRPIEGGAADGEFRILPYPMPDTAPGEATILPFPLPGAPVSFASWGSWIGF